MRDGLFTAGLWDDWLWVSECRDQVGGCLKKYLSGGRRIFSRGQSGFETVQMTYLDKADDQPSSA